MSNKIIERPRFYCEKINAYAKVKVIYTTPFPDSDRRILDKVSCDDNDLCPIIERQGNVLNPHYERCLFYLELKKRGIAE